jgi:transcriptional regulator with XRE-family HTH domain
MKIKRARALMEREGRTPKWLAARCGIEPISLKHILAGRREPGRPVLILIAQNLNTTIEDLEGEDQGEEIHPEPKAVG